MNHTLSEQAMEPKIRKLVCYEEETLVEGYKQANPSLKMWAVAAVLHNPWAGRFVENLDAEIQAYGPILGALLTEKIVAMAGSAGVIEAYGKAAVVGLDGEVEHASGLIHTLLFGNHYRKKLEAKSYLSFTNIRGGANTSITIPMMDKNDVGRRSHYLTVQFSIIDAPRNDEIVIALGGASGGRPHHRIGNRYQDLKALGGNIDNPASI